MSPDNNCRRIMAVDDDKCTLQMYQDIGACRGIKIEGHIHPDTALECLRNNGEKITAVITDLDYGLGDKNGHWFVKKVRQDPEIRKHFIDRNSPRIVIISGHAYTLISMKEELNELGVQVLPKPVDFEHLDDFFNSH